MKTLNITSSANAQFKVFQSLLTSKGIKKEGLFFLMGEKIIKEFLKSPSHELEFLIYSDEIPTDLKLSDLKLAQQVKFTQLSKELFNELDSLGTHYPLLVLKCPLFLEKDFSKKPKGLELIAPLGDPKNLGALARSAIAFGVHEIILTQESVHPYLPAAVKASAGAVLKVLFTRTATKVSEIPVLGENYVLDLKGKSIIDVKLPKDLRLWLGEEGPGLNLSRSQLVAVTKISIPTDHVESLNATVSASLALWEWRRRTLS